MAGQTIVIDCVRGDEVVVYAYTGTWLADFPMNHYTHWVGLLLKPNMDEVRPRVILLSRLYPIYFQADMLRKAVEEGEDPTAPAVVEEEE